MAQNSTWSIAAMLVFVVGVGCDKPPPSLESKEVPATAAQPEAEAEPELAAKPTAWTGVAEEALSPAQKAQMEKARAAQKALGGALVKALSQSVAEKGFPDSVEFCAGAAPDTAAKVAAEQGVKIGRTSKKLRNPENKPPEWAAATVAADDGKPHYFGGPAGELGVLLPVKTAGLCVNCHGAPDKLAEGVLTAVATKYPEDQATGFAEGDLRGWFWVEVAP